VAHVQGQQPLADPAGPDPGDQLARDLMQPLAPCAQGDLMA
jgi:hypothetical protein